MWPRCLIAWTLVGCSFTFASKPPQRESPCLSVPAAPIADAAVTAACSRWTSPLL
jgi:hypothetical protein